MNKLNLILLFFLFVIPEGHTMKLMLPHESANNGQTLSIPIRVEDFRNVVSIQFSINWNEEIIEFTGVKDGNLSNVAIGDVEAALGRLRLSWFDVLGQGVGLPDESPIVFLQFHVIGKAGDFTEVSITDNPLEVQIFQDSSGVFKPVEPDFLQGSVSVIAPLGISAGIRSVDCYGESSGAIELSITGNPGNHVFNWTGPEEFSSDQKNISQLISGNYNLIVSDSTGQVIYEASYLVEQPSSPIQIDDIETLVADCGQNNGSAKVVVSGGTPPYRYNFGNGPLSSPEVHNLAPGMYSIIVYDDKDCQLFSSFTIGSSEIIPLDLGPDAIICPGESLQIEAGSYASYSWSDGSTQSFITVEETGSYHLTVTDENDCIARDTISVIVLPDVELKISAEQTSICPGSAVRLEATGGTDYHWIDATNTLSSLAVADPIASPSLSTTYQVSSSNECSRDTAEITIEIFGIEATAGPDTCINSGISFQLAASGGIVYEWVESPFPLSAYDVPNPIVEPEDSATYVVAITDANGCRTIDSVFIAVANNPLEFIRRINIITPNGDHKNDVLEFPNLRKYGVNTLYIYNRWGDIIYEKLNYQSDEDRFDGTYKGKPLPGGTYYYVLAFRTEELKQALTIIRE